MLISHISLGFLIDFTFLCDKLKGLRPHIPYIGSSSTPTFL